MDSSLQGSYRTQGQSKSEAESPNLFGGDECLPQPRLIQIHVVESVKSVTLVYESGTIYMRPLMGSKRIFLVSPKVTKCGLVERIQMKALVNNYSKMETDMIFYGNTHRCKYTS